jgi:hypothetical protein
MARQVSRRARLTGALAIATLLVGAARADTPSQGEFAASHSGDLYRFEEGRWVDYPVGSQVDLGGGRYLSIDRTVTDADAAAVNDRLLGSPKAGPLPPSAINPGTLSVSQLLAKPLSAHQSGPARLKDARSHLGVGLAAAVLVFLVLVSLAWRRRRIGH